LLPELEAELVVELELAAAGVAELEAVLELELELEPHPASAITPTSAISGGTFGRITPPSFDGRHGVNATSGDGVLRVNDHGRSLALRRSWSKYTARIRIAPMTTCCQND
jgi:hypothetical protein